MNDNFLMYTVGSLTGLTGLAYSVYRVLASDPEKARFESFRKHVESGELDSARAELHGLKGTRFAARAEMALSLLDRLQPEAANVAAVEPVAEVAPAPVRVAATPQTFLARPTRNAGRPRRRRSVTNVVWLRVREQCRIVIASAVSFLPF